MNGKKIVLVIIILISLCLLSLGTYFYMQGDNKTKKEEPKTEEKEKKEKKQEEPTETDIKFSQDSEYIEKDSVEGKLLSSLRNIGIEIYNGQKFTTYEKKNGAYFISLKQLSSDFGYDISEFKGKDGTVCDKELTGIYFDTEKQMGVELGDNPPVIPILIGCSKVEKMPVSQTPTA